MGRRGGQKQGRSAQRASAKQRKAKRVLAAHAEPDTRSTRAAIPSKEKKAWRIAVQQETLSMIQSGSVAPTARLRRDMHGCVVVDLANLGRPQYVPVHASGGSGDEASSTGSRGSHSDGGAAGSPGRSGSTVAARGRAPAPAPFERSPLQVSRDDVGDVAARLHAARAAGDPLVCVLNMASQRNPGGGYKNGAAAQVGPRAAQPRSCFAAPNNACRRLATN